MRTYSWSQLLETGFDKSEYNFPTTEGVCIVLLVMNQWGDKACLTGFFVTRSSKKIKANTWQEKEYLGLDRIDLGTKGFVVLRKATFNNNGDFNIAG